MPNIVSRKSDNKIILKSVKLLDNNNNMDVVLYEKQGSVTDDPLYAPIVLSN